MRITITWASYHHVTPRLSITRAIWNVCKNVKLEFVWNSIVRSPKDNINVCYKFTHSQNYNFHLYLSCFSNCSEKFWNCPETNYNGEDSLSITAPMSMVTAGLWVGTRLGGGMRVASIRAARQVAQHSWRRGPHESTVQPSTRSPHSHCDPTERINSPSPQ